jgi:hypothetical protein
MALSRSDVAPRKMPEPWPPRWPHTSPREAAEGPCRHSSGGGWGARLREIIAGFCPTAVVSVFETGFLRIGTGVVAWTNPDLAWGVTRTA